MARARPSKARTSRSRGRRPPRRPPRSRPPSQQYGQFSKSHAVSFHNFKSQNVKLSVSNPTNKYVAYLSVLSQILNCQGLGRKNKFEILKTYRVYIYIYTYIYILYIYTYNVHSSTIRVDPGWEVQEARLARLARLLLPLYIIIISNNYIIISNI